MPSTPYLGEIIVFGGNFAPAGWLFCDGTLLAISQFDALFALIGTTYGGDGQTTFALPDLRGRVPIHFGTGPSGTTYTMGEMAGTEYETLISTQIPAHHHAGRCQTDNAVSSNPQGNYWASQPVLYPYQNAAANVSMQAGLLGTAGGSQPHENMQPFLALNFIIAVEGIFPSQV